MSGGTFGVIATTVVASIGGGGFYAFNESSKPSDPRLVAVKNAADNLIEQEHRIAEQMKRVAEIVEKAKSTPNPKSDLNPEELKKLVPPLKDLARKALDEHYRLVENSHELIREMKHAPDGYKAAAVAWRTRAEDYKNPGLKALPLSYAEDCEKLAVVLESRHKLIAVQLKRLEDLVPFLRETKMSVQDFGYYLDHNPGIGGIDATARYRGYLEVYARAHANFLAIINDYQAILRTPVPVVNGK